MSTLYVFWQNPETRRWWPVGMLTNESGVYQFAYTKGAKIDNDFIPFGRMNQLDKMYESKDLFPLFANRILSGSRPDFHRYIYWIGAESEPDNPFLILGRTGGERVTDKLFLYAKPEQTKKNEFDLFFLCHGISHLPNTTIDRVSLLNNDEIIFPMLDNMNKFDDQAVALRTDDPVYMIGYVPRFFARDIRVCIDGNKQDDIYMRVVRVNRDAPLQLRLLCRFTSPWPKGFAPCSGPEFEPLVELETRRPREVSHVS